MFKDNSVMGRAVLNEEHRDRTSQIFMIVRAHKKDDRREQTSEDGITVIVVVSHDMTVRDHELTSHCAPITIPLPSPTNSFHFSHKPQSWYVKHSTQKKTTPPDNLSQLPLQSALFNFQALLLVILLVICTCTYVRAVTPSLVDRNKRGSVHYNPDLANLSNSIFIFPHCPASPASFSNLLESVSKPH